MKTITIITVFLFCFWQFQAQTYEGIASFYDDKFNGRPTASGEIFDQNKHTAAHRTFPFGTVVRVTNLQNNRSITVVINDRGPFAGNRLIDLSKSAAKALDFIEQGLVSVQIEVVKSVENTAQLNVKKTLGNNEAAAKNNKAVNDISFPNEYYEMDIKFSKPSGYVVQVGSFTELANLMRMAQDLRRIYGKNLLVQVTDVSEKKVHRLLVGPFPDRPAAEQILQNLKSDFKDCFVVEMK